MSRCALTSASSHVNHHSRVHLVDSLQNVEAEFEAELDPNGAEPPRGVFSREAHLAREVASLERARREPAHACGAAAVRAGLAAKAMPVRQCSVCCVLCAVRLAICSAHDRCMGAQT